MALNGETEQVWKLSELYQEWFGLPETQQLVYRLVESLRHGLPLAEVTLPATPEKNPLMMRGPLRSPSPEGSSSSRRAGHPSPDKSRQPLLDITMPLSTAALTNPDQSEHVCDGFASDSSAAVDGNDDGDCEPVRSFPCPAAVSFAAVVTCSASASFSPSLLAMQPTGTHALKHASSPQKAAPGQPDVLPFFRLPHRLEHTEAAQAQQLSELRALLARQRLRLGSALMPSDIAAILPHLPGGRMSSYLCRSLWHKVHVFTNSGSAANAGQSLPHVVTASMFLNFFESQMAAQSCSGRLMKCLCEGRWGTRGWESDSWFASDALRPLLDEVVHRHPSLELLEGDVNSQRHYTDTVMLRILYALDPLRTGRVSGSQMRRAGGVLCEALDALDHDAAEEICLEGRFFSYEHFYVIFSKFTELDEDGDAELSCDDLQRYDNSAISQRATERIFLALRRSNGLMDYAGFVWFLLSEEDKSSSTAVGFWFRVLDADDDGQVGACASVVQRVIMPARPMSMNCCFGSTICTA